MTSIDQRAQYARPASASLDDADEHSDGYSPRHAGPGVGRRKGKRPGRHRATTD